MYLHIQLLDIKKKSVQLCAIQKVVPNFRQVVYALDIHAYSYDNINHCNRKVESGKNGSIKNEGRGSNVT